MTVTVGPDEDTAAPRPPRPGDVLHVPASALAELGVSDEPEVDVALAAAGRWPWAEVAAQDRDASVRLIVEALCVAFLGQRRVQPDDLRPTLRQVALARRLVTVAGEHAAGLVAHVCAWVMPAEFGARVAAVHSPQVCLGLYQAWCWPPDEPQVGQAPTSERAAQPRMTAQFSHARQVLREHVQTNARVEGRPAPAPFTAQRRSEEAELVAWRLGTSLQRVVWADGARQQAEIAAGRAVFEAWKATLPRPDRQTLAHALIEAWDAWVAVEKARVGAGSSG